MADYIIYLAQKYPIVIAVLAGMGLSRSIFKAVFAGAKLLAAATPTQKDDKIIEDVEVSKTYQFIMFVVDYLLSIKLPGQK